ncbi:MAG TPA: GntR family transcriptional regulator [Candidatus Thioglobus sp.]|nr:GntR family transcriptional regulator [Candidatus Thioglobus sp.]HIL20971.1 GntR family transcriptional regulator [Candidatus Thioglobus sp.]
MPNKAFSKVKPRQPALPVNEWVYATLCELILHGEFVPGVTITLRGIAESLDVSPMPVREAASRLISEGALEVSVKRRISVSQMTQEKFDELVLARLSLEPELAALALPYIDSERLKLLIDIDKKLDVAISTGNIEDYTKYNCQFHFGIYEAAPSPVLLPIIKSLWLRFSPFYRIVAGRAGTQTLDDYHEAAIDAIKAGDPVALAKAIHEDIEEGMDMLNESIGTS